MKLSSSLTDPRLLLFSVQILLAYEWIQGGWGKLSGGQFVSTIEKTLIRFGENSPYKWYTNSLLELAKDHAFVFGELIQWGELLTGIGLAITVCLYTSKNVRLKAATRYGAMAALFGGAFMNANFYLAAGWSNPSTSGLNMLMFWIEVVLLIAWWILPQTNNAPLSRPRLR